MDSLACDFCRLHLQGRRSPGNAGALTVKAGYQIHRAKANGECGYNVMTPIAEPIREFPRVVPLIRNGWMP
jgi:hypothetical protein